MYLIQHRVILKVCSFHSDEDPLYATVSISLPAKIYVAMIPFDMVWKWNLLKTFLILVFGECLHLHLHQMASSYGVLNSLVTDFKFPKTIDH